MSSDPVVLRNAFLPCFAISNWVLIGGNGLHGYGTHIIPVSTVEEALTRALNQYRNYYIICKQVKFYAINETKKTQNSCSFDNINKY